MPNSAPATLKEREAFLLTLLGKGSQMHHSSYCYEKIKYALDPWVTRDVLLGALDLENQMLFEKAAQA